MKKAFFYIILSLFLVQGVFSFDILNDNDETQIYFSLLNTEVTVKNDQNLTNLSVSFSTLTQTFNFNPCESDFCSTFNLYDLMVDNNLSFSELNEFDVNVNGESKLIYIDTKKPIMNVNNISVDKEIKKLIIEYNYSDNSNQIKTVELYKKNGNNLDLVADLKGKSQYSLAVLSLQEFDFMFKIYDQAGNFDEIEKNFEVEDIFEPQFITTKVIKDKDSGINIDFKIKDDVNLDKYEFSQNTLKVSENIYGITYENVIGVPFTSGEIIFRVFDDDGNNISKSINTNSPFLNSYDNKYSNDKTFEFRSNADSCTLTKLDLDNKKIEFSKSSNKFSLNLDVEEVKEYQLEFFCEDSTYKQFYSRTFYYDIEKPQATQLGVEKLSNGNLELTWDESEDNQSDVQYILYREGDDIYEGSKLKFEDKGVSYPNVYEYYLEVEDEAGNVYKTDKIEVIPKKIIVNLETNLQEKLLLKIDKYKLRVTTDVGSDVEIIVKNEGSVIDVLDQTDIQNSNLEFNLNLKEGTNQVIVKVTDTEGNYKEQIYYLNYVPDILAEPVIEQPVVEPVLEPINESLGQENLDESEKFWTNIFLLTVVIIIILIAIYMVLKILEKDKLIIPKKNKSHLYHNYRHKDKHLHKHIALVKKVRLERNEQRLRDEQRQKLKEEKELTYFEKKKLEDLKNRKEFQMPATVRNKAKKNELSARNDPEYDDNLKEVTKEERKREMKFGNWFKKKEKKQDPFSDYILKKRSEKSWMSTRDYLQSTQDEKQRKEQEKVMAKQVEQNQKLEEQRVIDEEKRKKAEAKERKNLEKLQHEEDKRKAKDNLHDYLGKRSKKKRFFFAEKHVERDILNRNKK